MARSPMNLILSYQYLRINKQILNAAYQPLKRQKTLDECILSDVWRKHVLPEVNNVVGKRTRIYLQPSWLYNVRDPAGDIYGSMSLGAEFYQVPSAAREGRDITAVERPTNYFGSTMSSYANGLSSNDVGNNVFGLAEYSVEALTLASATQFPNIQLMDNNIIRVEPQMMFDGLPIECLLEYDPELINVDQSLIYPLQNLMYLALRMDIYQKLLVPIDETEIVGGQELGVFKAVIDKWEGIEEGWADAVDKVMGGQYMSADDIRYLIREGV